jgi:hypothetical protein
MSTDRVPMGLEQVRAELEAWRGRRRKGDRIPEEVWRRAAGAVRQYGLNVVSRALRLDYYHLKRRAGRGPAARLASPLFVELSDAGAEAGQRTDTGLACVVELAKGNGTRMRICVHEVAGVDWGKLKEAFLGA